ncbi:MAG TPA: hypothetical protein VEN99_06630, partial [Acidimicrobiia bacterium]|nr:hypothetical protein [Acidimicrobiia bacterium]
MGERDVHTEAQVKPANVVRLREQISNLHSLFVLSMMMTESRDEDEILSLAVTSVASLGPCTTDGAYRPGAAPGGGPERFREPPGRSRRALAEALVALGADDGPADVPGAGWGWAFALRSLGGHWGWLVVGAETEPSADEQ